MIKFLKLRGVTLENRTKEIKSIIKEPVGIPFVKQQKVCVVLGWLFKLVKSRLSLSDAGAFLVFSNKAWLACRANADTRRLKIKWAGPRAALVFIGYLILVFIGSITAPSAVAQTMTNDFYIIQMGNLNSIAGISEGEAYKINITSGETAPNLNVGENFKARVGFQYFPRRKSFSISLSNTLIDFGSLSPTNPVTRTTVVNVNNLVAPGYNVTASENHQLLSPRTGAVIPDTTCDRGICNQNTASAWENTLTYGFGYRCDNISVLVKEVKSRGCISNDLTFYFNPNYYRQFPDSSKNEKALKIMNGNRGGNQKATITYKVNISSTQPAGLYTNSITYLAIPTF